MISSKPKRTAELDGLRGIAAVGVVLYHWSQQYTFWMWSFVDLFFVLSGFLITGLLLKGFLTQTQSLKEFWISRILRIWPVYYVTLLGVVVFLLVIHRQELLQSPVYLRDIALSSIFLQFLPMYGELRGDQMAMFQFLPGFLHSWSLAVEEQYYLIWPLLLSLLVRHWNLSRIAIFCALLVLIGPLIRYLGDAAPVLLLSRIDGLALGTLLAILHAQKTKRADNANTLKETVLYAMAAIAGLLLVAPYLWQGYRHGQNPMAILEQPLLVTGFSLFYFGLIALVLRFPGRYGFQLLASAPLVYLGSISYAIYMFHFPIMVFIKPRISEFLGAEWHFLSYPTNVLLLIGLPHLSKIYLEQPILALKSRLI